MIVATASQSAAKASPVVAKLAADPAKSAAVGTRAYYLARLQHEFPDLANCVAAGEPSVFRASVQVGLRKEPAKFSKWTKVDANLKREVVKI